MSRIGKLPISIPSGVDVKVQGQVVTVKGSKGTLSRTIPQGIAVAVEEQTVRCTPSVENKDTKAMWGLARMLISNMVHGVVEGYKKELEVVGVGYRAEAKGKALTVSVGFAAPVDVPAVDGITFRTDGPNKIVIEGIDKEVVGRVAAEVRKIRPPEPYNGKGIRYAGEHIVRKAGKAAGK
ncbi:MAG: 50S ribosomal protein L6 [Chitinivibrionales bacterium]|nr:50S ribosomal protein L6 [Chitinivibrionales bacterium]